MTHLLADSQYETLAALCEALLPSLEPPAAADEALADFYRRSASDVGVPRLVAAALRDYAAPDQQRQLKQFLDLLGRPLSAALLTGRLRRFADLPLEAREKILQRMSVSPVPPLRQAFQAVKRLAHSLYFSALNDSGENPNWPAIGYPGPDAPRPPDAPKPIAPLAITEDRTIDCDVVVIGSGAGGGVAAGVLAQAGLQVVVLEKGGYCNESDFTHREYEAFRAMYENAGLLTTSDLGVVVLAGSTLGGGTTINWSSSFRTPDHVLREWENEHHIPGLTGGEFQSALDAVCARGHVDTDETRPNQQDLALQAGCEKLGYHVALIPRNVNGCGSPPACGWCGFGCARGAKQGTLKTWLQDAHDAGAQIVVNCHADRVRIENGRAVGVAATVTEASGQRFALTVRARAVAAAAGSLHTPALLLRSGIENSNIGLNLRLHPATAVRGEFAEPIEMWRGVTQGLYSAQFSDLDGEGYGVVLETPPAHPGLFGFALPWLSARSYKSIMSRFRHQASIITIVRDRGSGRVTIGRDGKYRLHYKLSPVDAKHMMKGVEASLRILAAAGAKELGTLQAGLPAFTPGGAESEFADYLGRVRREGATANRVGLFTAHQMGTCRMGGERARSVVGPRGESWDVRSLFVADASVFPTPPGVNPMITIEAMAYRTACYLAARL